MLTSTRRALLVLLGVGMLGGLSLWQASLGENIAAAQGIIIKGRPPIIGPGGDVPPDPNEPNDQNSQLTLVTNPKIKGRLDAGSDYIKEKNWPQATKALQNVLNEKQDAFVPITSKGVDGKEQTQFISAKGEATRLIGTMPADGMDWYQHEFGPTAQAMLNEAMDKSDVALLAEIAKRFLYTDAGNKATTLLATHQLDRGD